MSEENNNICDALGKSFSKLRIEHKNVRNRIRKQNKKPNEVTEDHDNNSHSKSVNEKEVIKWSSGKAPPVHKEENPAGGKSVRVVGRSGGRGRNSVSKAEAGRTAARRVRGGGIRPGRGLQQQQDRPEKDINSLARKNAVMMLNEMFPPPGAPQYKV